MGKPTRKKTGRSREAVWMAYLTAKNRDEAMRIATALVEERLAACVNVLPGLQSVYRWGGHIEQAEECALVLKTRADRFKALCERVRALHSYEVPCIVAWPIADGHAPFLEWVRQESAPTSTRPKNKG